MILENIGNYSYHFQKAKNLPSKGTIVFVHGFATNSSYHNEFVKRLTDYDYYAIELPGHGIGNLETKKDLSPYKLSLHVVKWIELLKLNNFILIGHSMGGGIVGMVSTMIPNKIKKLIMVTPMNSSVNLNLINVFKFIPKNNQETLEMQKMLYKDYTKHFKSENDLEIINETKYQQEHADNFRILRRKMCSPMNLIKLRKLEKKITVPSLLMVGKGDGIINWKSALNLFSNKNNFQLFLFDESGHLPFIEEPDLYYEQIMDFINS